MASKNKLVTGKSYTLAALFSGDNKIFIPDLQRDYCWGNPIHTEEKKELVSGFVSTLIERYDSYTYSVNNIPTEQHDTLNLGLIYGYESPECHIQLCDGQQRITTLFLLLGMLNKKSADNIFQKLLISDNEYLNDDKEPYLQYAIRESSLYFLSDLVCHFFIKEENDFLHVENVGEIKKCSWYFNDYKTDPSICSIILALQTIDEVLKDKNNEWCNGFGEYISKNLTFMYYDMVNRMNGEETFVVINTTGEPLSTIQNLKPQIFQEHINIGYIRECNGEKHSMSEDWETVETWFWRKRQNGNDTADAGFNEFLRWVTMLNADDNNLKYILSKGKYNFPKKSISFESIFSYWEIVKYLFDTWEYKELLDKTYLSPSIKSDIKIKVIEQIDCFIILPLIAYCKKWGIPQNGDKNLLRLYNFIYNLTRIDNVRKSVNELVGDVIRIADNCRDIISLLDEKRSFNVSQKILTKEEILKLNIIKSNIDIRDEIEDCFWAAQSRKYVQAHNIWSGEIFPLLTWASDGQKFSLLKFKQYQIMFDRVFEGNCDGNIDVVRRAILASEINNYPQIIKGYKNYSFGWEWQDWNIIINNNIDKFRNFFDCLIKGESLGRTIEESMMLMIEDYDESKKWAEFVHKKYLLQYCEEKNIQWDEKLGWLLIKKKRATTYISVNNRHLVQYLQKNMNLKDYWRIWMWDGNRVVVENGNDDIVFDIWYEQNSWKIELFRRGVDVQNYLKKYIDDSWLFNGNRYEKSIEFMPNCDYEYNNVKELIEGVIDSCIYTEPK